MIKIQIEQKTDGHTVTVREKGAGRTLLAMLQEAQIYMDAPCGGKGNCGRCRVEFVSGAPAATPRERQVLTEAEIMRGIRLACAAVVKSDCRIVLPRQEQMEALTGPGQTQLPSVRGLGQAKAMSGKGQRVSDCNAAHEKGAGCGIAVDIGTTTLAAALLDLRTGAQIAVSSLVNHQRAYGADVISRIRAANEGNGALLSACIRADLAQLFTQLLRRGQTAGADVSDQSVQKIAIVGNTVMCHLLRGLSCAGIGKAPFVPADLSMWEGSIGALIPELGTWAARAVILPGISAFVGADIVAGVYACDMDRMECPGLFLDIGTNGEMAVGDENGCLVTSTAAGPVFEGGNISCGVAGIPGAVTHVSLLCRSAERGQSGGMSAVLRSFGDGSRTALRSRYETIGGAPPVGLCGSGIIDAAGELLRTGLMDAEGLLCEPWFAGGVPVAGDAVRFTQRDIREVQMGKAAVRAGIETLLFEYKKRRKAAQNMPVRLAGGFGYAMNTAQAVRIGMFPQSFAGRAQAVGNTALEGAKKFLLAEEQEAKERILAITARAEEINLAMHPDFQARYIKSMTF